MRSLLTQHVLQTTQSRRLFGKDSPETKGDKMNSVSAVRCLVPRASRTFSTSIRSQIENKVKNNQHKFQESDGQPVHLKGGMRDRLIYISSALVTGAGTLWACSDLFTMSFKK